MQSKTISDKSLMEGKIKQGMQKIASVVKRTLGPGGLTIFIERHGQALNGEPLAPILTKDGVTVARECRDPDAQIDLVIQAVQEICNKTNKIAGDGTTTAIVLGESILNETFKELDANPDLNPQLVRESVEAVALEVRKMLAEEVQQISNAQKIAEVATISANGDQEIGRIIMEAFEKVGSEGVITVDEGHSNQTTIQVVDGFQIRRGAEAQDRFFNNSDNNKFEADNCYVLLYNGSLRSYTDVLPAFKAIQEQIQREGKGVFPPILIVADEFSQEMIQYLLINRAEAGLSVCAIKSPHVSNIRTAMMDDIAIMLGGKRLGNGNRDIKTCTLDDIGIAAKVVVDKYTTTFYDGQGTEDDIKERIESLKVQRTAAESPYDAQLLSDRIAALANGVAIIGVGGTTEIEIKERYHRIEDALNAARAAVEEGVIPGGGVALAKIAEKLSQLPDQSLGVKILSRALMAPFQQISENIGQDGNVNFAAIKERVMNGEMVTYDARKKIVVDAFEAGIIDPVKVCRTALENAVSIAALLSTCGGGITYTREK